MPNPPAPSSTRRILIPLSILLLLLVAVVIGFALRGGSGIGAESEIGESGAIRPEAATLLGAASDEMDGERVRGQGDEQSASARELVATKRWRDSAQANFSDAIEWTGCIRDAETDAPIEAVEIELRGARYVGRATSDEAGEFTMSWSANLAATLALAHPLYVDLQAPEVDLATPGEFTLLRSGRIEGRVRPFTAHADARIQAWRQAASSRRFWEPLQTEIEEDGSFHLLDLREGDYALTAQLPDAFVELKMGIHVPSGETTEVTLEAAGASSVFGRVTRRDTAGGIADAKLEIEPRTDGLPSEIRELRSAETTSLADGTYELTGLAPGIHRLRVRAPWGATDGREVHIPASGSRIELDLLFPGPARLSGYVLDADEKGVVGATVLASSSRDRGRRSFSRGRIDEETPHTVSGGSGFFLLENIPSDRELRVVAYPPGTGPVREGEAELPDGLPGFATAKAVAAGEEGTDVVVRIPPHHEIVGRVTAAEDGVELAGVLVRAEYGSGRRRMRAAHAVTDEEGMFRLTPLREAEVTVRAWGEGFLAQLQVVKTGGEAPAEVEFALERSLSISGVARDEAGFGVPRIPIRVEVDEDFVAAEEDSELRRSHTTSTDEYGRFHFDDLFPAPWIVDGGSFEWELVDADPGVLPLPAENRTTLTFAPRDRPQRFTIVGRVSLVSGDVPIGVRIDGLRGGVLEVDGGEFEASGLTPTRHRLRISADGHVPRTVGPIEPLPGGTVDVGVVELIPATRLTVKIDGVPGKKEKDVRVMLIPLPTHEGGIGEEGARLTLESVGKGRYRHARVPRFAYRLVARHEELGRYSGRIEIGDRPEQSVKIKLK